MTKKTLLFLTALAIIANYSAQAQIYVTTTHIEGTATGKYDANTGVLMAISFIFVIPHLTQNGNVPS